MKLLKYIVFGIVAVLVGLYGWLFAQSNYETISVDFLALQLSGSIAMFLIGALAVGGALGLLASLGVMFSLKAKQLQSARQVKKIEKEMSKLRQPAPVA